MLLSGMVAATPGQGGAVWAVLQYVLGFRDLGWDVWFVEPAPLSAAPYCDSIMATFGLADRWALLEGDQTAGAAREDVLVAASRAELLVNISGMLTDPAVLERIDTRVYLDLDPAFVQLWQAVQGIDMRFDAHTHFVSLSDRIGAPGSVIPDCGRHWLPLLPPVVLDRWPVSDQLEHDALTTVTSWRGYGSIDLDGVRYGQKAHSLRPLMDLPRHVNVPVEIALGIHPDETTDLQALNENGWQLLDPAELCATPADFQRFVAGSWAEIGIAKSGYVLSDSGWFSDRSAAYLASGRPVIAQDTGFSRRLPVGQGLFAFREVGDIAAAVDALRADYPAHREAARAVVEQHLDSRKVLSALLEQVLA